MTEGQKQTVESVKKVAQLLPSYVTSTLAQLFCFSVVSYFVIGGWLVIGGLYITDSLIPADRFIETMQPFEKMVVYLGGAYLAARVATKKGE